MASTSLLLMATPQTVAGSVMTVWVPLAMFHR
jgi:hypothetical protein